MNDHHSGCSCYECWLTGRDTTRLERQEAFRRYFIGTICTLMLIAAAGQLLAKWGVL